jgi:hypothetical protein
MIPKYFYTCWKEFRASGLGQKVAVIVAVIVAVVLMLLLFMFLGAQVANAASVVTITPTDISNDVREANVITIAWTAHTDGTVTSTQSADKLYGYIALVVVDPGTPAPQALYDVTLTDSTGIDVMGGALADLSATAGLQTMPIIGPSGTTAYAGRFIDSKLTFNLSNNNVSGAKGTVYIYLVK